MALALWSSRPTRLRPLLPTPVPSADLPLPAWERSPAHLMQVPFCPVLVSKSRRRRGNRGWDGRMTSSTQWTWVWANSGRQWAGKPGVLQSMGSQRVRHNWVTEHEHKINVTMVNTIWFYKQWNKFVQNTPYVYIPKDKLFDRSSEAKRHGCQE